MQSLTGQYVSVIPRTIPSGGVGHVVDFEGTLVAQLAELKRVMLNAHDSCLRSFLDEAAELPPSAPSPVTAHPPTTSPGSSGWLGPRVLVTDLQEGPAVAQATCSENSVESYELSRRSSLTKANGDRNAKQHSPNHKALHAHFDSAVGRATEPSDECEIEDVSEEIRTVEAPEAASGGVTTHNNGNTLQAWGQGSASRPNPHLAVKTHSRTGSKGSSNSAASTNTVPTSALRPEHGDSPPQKASNLSCLASKVTSARVSFIDGSAPGTSDYRGPSCGLSKSVPASAIHSARVSFVNPAPVPGSTQPVIIQTGNGHRIRVNESRSMPNSRRGSQKRPEDMMHDAHSLELQIPSMERISLALDRHLSLQGDSNKRGSLVSRKNERISIEDAIISATDLRSEMAQDFDHFARVSEAPSGVEDGVESQPIDRDSMRSDGAHVGFEPYACWKEKVHRFSVSVKSQKQNPAEDESVHKEMDEDSDDEVAQSKHYSENADDNPRRFSAQRTMNRLLARFMVPPSHKLRILWDMFSAVILFWDFLILPLEFYDLTEVRLLNTMGWVTRLFWTTDFPFSFFTGFQTPSGRVEMRPWKVVRNYLSSLWFPFDILILSFDWLEMAYEELSGFSIARLGRIGKLTRLMRLLRLGRVRRIKNLPTCISSLVFMLNSDFVFVLSEILGIMLMLAGLAHILGCIWYNLGKRDGWVEQDRLETRSLDYRYVTSFSWSLTQLTFGGGGIGLKFDERLFSVGTALVGFLVSVTVVSSITSSMTRLQIIRAGQSSQVSMLNQYLFDNGISTKVALRVQRNAMYALEQQKKNTPESSIELLDLVSEPLRVELHYEIHMPVVCHHPFFKCYNEVNAAAMRRICHVAISTLPLSRGDVLFSTGEVPREPCMYFNLHGKMKYHREGWPEAFKVRLFQHGDWACEAAPWTPWVHHGVMRARAECKLMMIDCKSFQEIAAQFRRNEFYPQKFAQAYLEALNKADPGTLTDLDDANLGVDEICENVFNISQKRLGLKRVGSKHFRRSECRGLERTNSTWSLTKTTGRLVNHRRSFGS